MKRKEERGDDSNIIDEWKAYRNYTQYALEEIEKGDLDHWFERKFSTAEMEVEMDELDHITRAKWLTATISETTCHGIYQKSRTRKYCPMTSISVVSNTPPLIVMSLSQNREGRQRDTYLNLIETKECELQFLAPTKKAAEEVDLGEARRR